MSREEQVLECRWEISHEWGVSASGIIHKGRQEGRCVGGSLERGLARNTDTDLQALGREGIPRECRLDKTKGRRGGTLKYPRMEKNLITKESSTEGA